MDYEYRPMNTGLWSHFHALWLCRPEHKK